MGIGVGEDHRGSLPPAALEQTKRVMLSLTFCKFKAGFQKLTPCSSTHSSSFCFHFLIVSYPKTGLVGGGGYKYMGNLRDPPAVLIGAGCTIYIQLVLTLHVSSSQLCLLYDQHLLTALIVILHYTCTPSGVTILAAMSCSDSSQRPPPFVPRLWKPPKDSDKPPLPYIIGFNTQIQSHVPPPPFGQSNYDNKPRPELSWDYLETVTQSELVVDNPPLETAPSQSPATARLTINMPISVGGADGAQVVTCSITPEAGPAFQSVAKIYDPLYYSFKEWAGHSPRDVVNEADQDYSREAAAYKHLQETGQTGSFAPTYYGSWTFSIPITSRGKTQTRPVRLVLIEYLGGPSIRGSLIRNDDNWEGKDAYHYPEEYRLEVLAMAMDGYVRQMHSGIDQMDFADRNVMLAPRQPSQDIPIIAGLSLPRVVLVDYNAAIIYTQTKRGKPPHMDWPRPCNPMWYFWEESMADFAGWVPLDWHRNPKFQQQWLQKRFGTEEMLKMYAPVTAKLSYTDYDSPEYE